MRREPGMLMGWTAPGVGLLMFAFVGCDSNVKPPPTEARLAPTAPTTIAEPGETGVSHLEPGGSGTFANVQVSFALQPSFAERFKGAAADAVREILADAFQQSEGTDELRMTIREDKALLSAVMKGDAALQNAYKLAHYLRENGWWRESDRATTRAESDPILEEARSKAAGFSQGLLQMESADIRDKTLKEVAEALGSGKEAEVLAGLDALGAVAQLDLDHSQFRGLVLPLLDSASPKVRAGAIGGLLATKPQPGDLGRVLPMVDDESAEVRARLPFAIKTLSGGDLTGEAAPAIIRLLEGVKPSGRRMFLSALWGSKYSPELEARLVELATPLARDTAYDAMYYSLSTQQNKGEGTIDVLISCLSHPDQGNVVQRALWGMAYGVEEPQQERVADAVLNFFTTRSGLRDQTLRVLGQYGVEKHALALSQYAEKPGLPKEVREAVIKTVAGIRARQ